MTQRKNHWINSPWTISIATTLLSLLLTIVYDYFKNKPILTTIWFISKWIGDLFWTILNFNLKAWWIIAAVLVFILINKLKEEPILKPDFYNYREGKPKRWKWTWKWEWNKGKGWRVSDMTAHCPNCKTAMIDYSDIYGFFFDCPRCDFEAKNKQCEDPHKIETIILDDIDKQREKRRKSR